MKYNRVKIPRRDGIVCEWLLDGNAVDTSWSGNNGTATNVTFATSDRGYQSQAGVFNGSSSDTSISSALGFNTNGNNNCSMMCWFKLNALPTSGNSMALMFLAMDPASWTRFFYRAYITNSAGTYQLNLVNRWTFNVTPVVGRWYHFAFTTDTSQNNKAYLDGAPVISTTANDSASATNTPRFAVWISNFNTGKFDFINWTVTSARVFSRTLSASEILDWYEEGLRKLGGSSLSGLMDNLSFYLDSKGDANDIIGGNNGTVTGAALTTDYFGNSNSAYNFDGNDFITHTHATPLQITTGSFEIFAYVDATQQNFCNILCKRTSGTNIEYQIMIAKNAGYGADQNKFLLQYYAGGAVRQAFSSALYTTYQNTWVHIVVTVNAGAVKWYFNWVDDGSSYSGNALVASTANLLVGVETGAAANTFFTGKIGFVRLYPSRVFTVAEALALYRLSSREYLLPFS